MLISFCLLDKCSRQSKNTSTTLVDRITQNSFQVQSILILQTSHKFSLSYKFSVDYLKMLFKRAITLIFILTISVILAIIVGVYFFVFRDKKPNVIIIIADDMVS